MVGENVKYCAILAPTLCQCYFYFTFCRVSITTCSLSKQYQSDPALGGAGMGSPKPLGLGSVCSWL